MVCPAPCPVRHIPFILPSQSTRYVLSLNFLAWSLPSACRQSCGTPPLVGQSTCSTWFRTIWINLLRGHLEWGSNRHPCSVCAAAALSIPFPILMQWLIPLFWNWLSQPSLEWWWLKLTSAGLFLIFDGTAMFSHSRRFHSFSFISAKVTLFSTIQKI